MALTKNSITLLSSATSVAAGLTKATAVFGPWMDVRSYYRMRVSWKVTNGSPAPTTAPCTLLVQTSPDNGTTIYDDAAVGGDLVASSVSSGGIPVDDPVMYIRVGAYGNSPNPVTAEATLQEISDL